MSSSNVPITPGTGANIATDLIGGNNYQIVKLDVGALGSNSAVSGSVPISQGPDLTISGTASALGSAIVSVNVGVYGYVAYQHTVAGTGCTFAFQISNDGTNWYPYALLPVGVTNPQPVATITSPGAFIGPVPFAYFQIVCTQYGSGTASGIAVLSAMPSTSNTVSTVEGDTSLTMRRLVKLLESNAVVDSAGRQRVYVDGTPTVAVNVNAGQTIATVTSVGTVTTVTGVTTVNTVTSLAQLAGVDARYQFIYAARQAYGAAIRAKLV